MTLALLGATALTAQAQKPVAAAPRVIDGPSGALVSPSGLGLSIARDGTGGLVYLKQAAGATRVFVSQLRGGTFQPPAAVDTGLPGPSSQPVIAAGNGGALLTAFINGGRLYVVDRRATAGPLAAPIALATGAINPSIEMTNFGKAYIAFTLADGAGEDVRTAFYYNGRWSLEAAPLNAVPADDAGTGSGRPRVGAAGDGIAVVVWGENGHIYSRRVSGTSPSVVDEQADAPLPSCSELSAGEPVVGVEGDSSYAEVAFHEQLSCAAQSQSRVLMRRLRGSQYEGIAQPDGLSTPASDGADQPQIAMGEYGDGFVTSSRQTAHDVFATVLGSGGAARNGMQVNALPNLGPPDGVPAMAGLYSSLIAWQQTPGAAGPADIRVRYAPGGAVLGPEQVLSSPLGGAVDASAGLAAAGDVSGDAAVAWLQGTGSSIEVVAAQLYQPVGGFQLRGASRYRRSSHPALAWSPPSTWGPMLYQVRVDGRTVAQTSATSVRVPDALANGPHQWQVRAINPAGLMRAAGPKPLFVDTVPPRAAFTLFGGRTSGGQLGVNATYRDLAPPHAGPTDASGVEKITVRWGDGAVTRLRPGEHRALHVYRRAGRYKVALVVTDRAGNATTIVRSVKIVQPESLPPARRGGGG